MTNLTAAQKRCYDALKAYGKPYAGGEYSTYREPLEGFKANVADALVRKGVATYTFDAEEKRGYYAAK